VANRFQLGVVLFCLGFSGSGWAGVWTPKVNAPVSAGASIGQGAYTSVGTTFADLLKGEVKILSNGRDFQALMSRALTSSALASAALRVAKLAGPVGIAISLANMFWEDLDSDGDLEWTKAGSSSGTFGDGQWKDNVAPVSYYSTAVQACTGACSKLGKSYCGITGGGTSAVCQCTWTGGCGNFAGASLYLACPAGTYWAGAACMPLDHQLASDADIQSAINNSVGTDASKAAAAAAAVIAAGGLRDLESASGPMTVSGPSSVPSVTSTSSSTGPDGTTTVDQSTAINITYQGDTINITNTTTTTTTYPDASTETTVDTKGGTNPVVPPQDPVPALDLCVEHPEASGCAPLDIPPDGEVLPTEDHEFDWAPTRTAAGSCPSPIMLSILGTTHALKWDPVCDFAEGIRPFVIIGSILGAGILLFSTVRAT
jgi:hypothetical protein